MNGLHPSRTRRRTEMTSMRATRTFLLAAGALALIVAGAVAMPAGTTSALWRDEATVQIGTLRFAQVDVELEPDFHVDDLLGGQYVKVTPGDDYTVVSF